MKECRFGDLSEGSIFNYGGDVFAKAASPVKHKNAVWLTRHPFHLCYFSPGTVVEVINFSIEKTLGLQFVQNNNDNN